MSGDSPPDPLYRGAGRGVWAGLLAAVVSLWLWGGNLLYMAFFYGFAMPDLRGWVELAGILAMILTTVLVSAIYEVIGLGSPGLGVTIGLSTLAFALFLVSVFTVTALVDKARTRAFHDSESMVVDVARSQHWEERYFAVLRASWAAGKSARLPYLRPIAWTVLGFAVAVWSDNRIVASVAWGLVFFQVIVGARMLQYWERLNQPNADHVLARAQHPPILFLRPFSLDALPVSPIGDQWYAFIRVLSWLDKRTFEEHLSSTFADLGPVIAIGRPGEEVPLLGAAREYADDSSWQALVRERAAVSQFVIMEVDASPGMEWEIDNVSKLVGLQRILIVLPPGEDLIKKRPEGWDKRWAELQGRFPFLPDVSEDTAGVLYDWKDQPVSIASDKSSVLRSLTALKEAWVRARLR